MGLSIQVLRRATGSLPEDAKAGLVIRVVLPGQGDPARFGASGEVCGRGGRDGAGNFGAGNYEKQRHR